LWNIQAFRRKWKKWKILAREEKDIVAEPRSEQQIMESRNVNEENSYAIEPRNSKRQGMCKQLN